LAGRGAAAEQGSSEETDVGVKAGFAAVIYTVAFIVGAIVMSFEMLGSRYLNPYFGSGIYTWASLISTVLASLTVGYFLGGWLADRRPSAPVLGATVLTGSLYILLLPLFAQPMLEAVLERVDDIKTGSLISSLAILFFPVAFLGMYSPFAIRLLLVSAERSGRVSGTVYGISTAGSIVGTLGTTFYLIPSIGSRAITLSLGLAGICSALLLIFLPSLTRRRAAAALALVALIPLLAAGPSHGEELVDEKLRRELMAKPDGQIARIETEYNDIYINKRRNALTMSFQLKGWHYTESVTNLSDPDDLPVAYTRTMTASLVYPRALKRLLMIGLGGGSISTYLGRAMKEIEIDTVEIDPGVIDVARKFFGIKDSPRVRYLDGDGRVFLTRNKTQYDLILVDAFHGGYVPFHLLTREFYALVRQRLAPGGAAVFNVHDGTRLYASTLRTLGVVFATTELYPSGEGEVSVVVTDETPEAEALERRAAALQEAHGFRYALPALLAKRRTDAKTQGAKGELLSDDFAPVDLYGATSGPEKRRR
jgi:spermidine synthase